MSPSATHGNRVDPGNTVDATDAIVIVVPGSPDRILAPNRRAHGKRKAAATAQHRSDAYFSAAAAVAHLVLPVFVGPVHIAVLIRWAKGERSKDLDSCAVCVKPMIDGLADARVIANDAQMKRLSIEQERDTAGLGEVVLTVSAA